MKIKTLVGTHRFRPLHLPTRLFLFLLSAGFFSIPSKMLASSGTEGASFLDIPVGGRPAALGNAYAAVAYDAYAPVLNPAGLGFIERSELAGMHLSYLESINYEYASFVHPLTVGHSIGAAIQYFRPGDVNATNANGDPAGTFSGSYAAYSLAYGQTISDKWTLGVTGKLLHAGIANYSAEAYGADLGTMYSVTERLMLAGLITNIGTKLTFINNGDSLPLTYKAGASYWVGRLLNLNLQGEYAKTGLASAHTGVEWHPIEMIALRAGFRTDTVKELSAIAGLTTGIGLHLFGQEFDYAFIPVGDLGSTHYFSLVLRWGEAERAKRNLIRYAHRQPEKPEKEGFWSVYNFDEHDLPPEGTLIAQPLTNSQENAQ